MCCFIKKREKKTKRSILCVCSILSLVHRAIHSSVFWLGFVFVIVAAVVVTIVIIFLCLILCICFRISFIRKEKSIHTYELNELIQLADDQFYLCIRAKHRIQCFICIRKRIVLSIRNGHLKNDQSHESIKIASKSRWIAIKHNQ